MNKVMYKMMKLYNSLKQSQNYNIIIGAIFWCGAVLFIFTLARFIVELAWMGILARDISLNFLLYGTIGMWSNIFNGIFICCFSMLLCKKTLKLFIALAIILIALGVLGFGFYSIGEHCAIMGIVCYYLTKKENVDIAKTSKVIIISLIAFGIMKMPLVVWIDMRELSDTTTYDYILCVVRYFSSMIFNPEYFLAFLLYKETKSKGQNIGKINKTAIIVWTVIAISFIYSNVQSICELNEYTEWKVLLSSPTELKEGDWDGWTTEEDLKKLEEPDWGEE